MRRHIDALILWAAIAVGIPASLSAQTSYDTSPQAQTGQQIYGSYFGTDIDTIGLYNGNLTLSIPLFSLPGRELPYGLTLTYNSQKWQSNTCSGSPCGQYTGGWQKANVFGSAPSFFVQYDAWCGLNRYNVYWIDGNGTKHRYASPCAGSPAVVVGQSQFEYFRFGRIDILDRKLHELWFRSRTDQFQKRLYPLFSRPQRNIAKLRLCFPKRELFSAEQQHH